MFIVYCNILKPMPVLLPNLLNLILDTNSTNYFLNQTCAIYTYLIEVFFLELVSFKCICATLIPIRFTLTRENLIINICLLSPSWVPDLKF